MTAVFACTVFAARVWSAEPGFALRDGDRVAFLGDSITEQRLYTSYIEAFTMTRFPKAKFAFWNAGWGGDTSWLRARSFPDEKILHAAAADAQQKMIEESVDGPLQRDILTFKPTVVFVNFGMNDHNYETFREDIFKTYVRSQTHLVKSFAKNQARTVLLTPQPIESKGPDPSVDVRNVALRKFSDGLKGVATAEGATFVDQFDPYMTIVKREHARDAASSVGGGDEVHPGPAGHTLMAAIILKKLNAPALVSRVELAVSDGSTGKVVASEKCLVGNFKIDGGTISFERIDDSLPMPIDPRALNALKLAPVLADLNRYELKVTGLKEDRYEISIDDALVATVGREELAQGWNLSNAAGPINKQAQEVLALIFQKNETGKTLWEARIHNRKEQATLPQVLADLEATIDATRQSKPHKFALKPAAK